MYESYFKLLAKPFDLVPNPDFLYLSKSHKKVLTYLDYGIRERVGFILLTGEVGSGKTTIIRDMIKKYHGEVVISKIFNTKVSSDQLVALINDDFGIPVIGKDKTVMLRDLNDFLVEQYAKGNFPVLIIDEAQNLTAELLEEIRMLSNLETDSAKLLQIILVGQPELRHTISAPSLRQLRQRISINCHLQPLSRQEIEGYITHRLEVAGNRNAVVFSPGALDLIYSNSCGIPRLVNIICDFLLISAFAEERKDIDEELVRDVIEDLDFDHHFWQSETTCDLQQSQQEPESIAKEQVVQELKQIMLRLDNMENNTKSHEETIGKELAHKLTELHNAFLFHVKETDHVINALSKKVDVIYNQKMNNKNVMEESGKDVIVRRGFGG